MGCRNHLASNHPLTEGEAIHLTSPRPSSWLEPKLELEPGHLVPSQILYMHIKRVCSWICPSPCRVKGFLKRSFFFFYWAGSTSPIRTDRNMVISGSRGILSSSPNTVLLMKSQPQWFHQEYTSGIFISCNDVTAICRLIPPSKWCSLWSHHWIWQYEPSV